MGDGPLGDIEDKGTGRNNRWYGVVWLYYLIYLFNENITVLIRSNLSQTWSIGSSDSLLALLCIHCTYSLYIQHTPYLYILYVVHAPFLLTALDLH